MARKSRYTKADINTLKVALYIRLSEEDGDGKTSESVKSQKSMLEDFVRNMKGIETYEFYVDDGYTGGNFDRPAFKTMLNDILARKINCVIVKDLSRFGRNYTEVSKYLQVMFPTLEVRFIAINDNIDSELNADSIDTLLIGLNGLMNEEYLKDCSIKSKMSYNLRQTKGQFTSPVAPYGYKRDENDIHKLVVDYKVKDVVKFIFNDFIEKQSFMAVTKDLCEKQIPTPSEYKQMQNPKYYTNRLTNKQFIWSRDTVTTILKNQVYIGNMAQHRREIVDYKTKKCKKLPKEQWVIIENTHEPIIDKETFNQVQDIINSKNNTYFQRKHKTNRNDNYFSGILYCGNCNSKMTYVDDKNRKYTFYKCKLNSMSSNLCEQEIIKTATLTKLVLQIIHQYIKLICDIEKLVNQIETYKNQNKSVKHKPQDMELKKQLLYESYRNAEISLEEYQQQKQELETLKQPIRKEKAFKENEFVKNFIKHKSINNLNREIVECLIEKIIVYNETNVEISFKFQDEFERILREVEHH